MPQGHQETKLRQLEQKVKKQDEKILALKKELTDKKRECRSQRQRIRELKESRSHVRMKYVGLKKCAKAAPARRGRVAGHKYSSWLMGVCILLHTYAGSSLRGVTKTLLLLRLELGLGESDIPSRGSVDNWAKRLGCHGQGQYGPGLYPDGYALIVDESMVVGQERMLVALGVPAAKEGEAACGFGDVRLLHLSVRASWDSAGIRDFLLEVKEKMGVAPLYVVSDACSSLTGGIRGAGLPRVCDVGHEVGKYIKQVYDKDKAFMAFGKAAGESRFREVMKATAYLMPPAQRSVARFMNYSHLVGWAQGMLDALPGLTAAERDAYGWVEGHRPVVVELAVVFKAAHEIMECLKNKGLSHCGIKTCMGICDNYRGQCPDAFLDRVAAYLGGEKTKLPDEKTCWHASSDIIESLFGKFKHHMASNKLNGVTPSVLKLSVITQFGGDLALVQKHLENALPQLSHADLDAWIGAYLTDNDATKRKKTLRKPNEG